MLTTSLERLEGGKKWLEDRVSRGESKNMEELVHYCRSYHWNTDLTQTTIVVSQGPGALRREDATPKDPSYTGRMGPGTLLLKKISRFYNLACEKNKTTPKGPPSNIHLMYNTNPSYKGICEYSLGFLTSALRKVPVRVDWQVIHSVHHTGAQVVVYIS